MAWKVVMEPVGNLHKLPEGGTDGEEEEPSPAGMILYLSGEVGKLEMSRVGLIRRNTKNPEVSFEEQLDREVTKVRYAMKYLGEAIATAGELQ